MSDHQPANVTHLSGYDTKPRGPFIPQPQREGTGFKKFTAKGHDKQLEDYQYSKVPVLVYLISGEVVEGSVFKRDKYTITVCCAVDGVNDLIYKHAIERIRPAATRDQA